jgi:hypothetical protein
VAGLHNNLTDERIKQINQEGAAAWADYLAGYVALVQRRVSAKACEYQAISTKTPTVNRRLKAHTHHEAKKERSSEHST